MTTVEIASPFAVRSPEVSPAAVAIAIVLLLLSTILLGALLWLILRPVRALFISHKDRKRLRTAVRQLAVADAALDREQPKDALRALRYTLVLEPISDSSLFDLYREHHQNVLSRFVLVAEATGSHSTNLANVEALLMQRLELTSLLLRAQDSYQNLSSRRAREGKGVPAWSRTDFESKIRQIEIELAENLKQIRPALDELFRSLRSPGSEPIVYH